MQAYLPIIQDQLFQWYQLTLDNAAYAAALAASVWLLTVLFYRIRIAFINRGNRTKAKENQNSVDAAQQQAQKLQEELSANTARMEESEIAANTATQRALDLERRITEHNIKLNDSLQALTISFDLDRPASSAEGDLEPESLWQQYSAAIAQLTERLRAEQQAKTELQQTYQSETARLAKKETLLETLQAQLDTQAHRIAGLEEQNALLQQQIPDSAQKQQSDITRLAELEKPAVEQAHAAPRQLQPEEDASARNVLIDPLEKAEQIQPSIVEQQQAPAELEEPPAMAMDIEQPSLAPTDNPINEVNSKIAHIFGGAREQIAKRDEKAATWPATADKTTEEPQSVPTESTMEAIQAEPSEPESQPETDKAPKLAGKLKHMLGTARQRIAKLDEKLAGETAMADNTATESWSVQMEGTRADNWPKFPGVELQPFESVGEQSGGVTGKIKNLFGARKSSEEEAEAVTLKLDEYETLAALAAAQQSREETSETDGTGKKTPMPIKSLFRKFQPNA